MIVSLAQAQGIGMPVPASTYANEVDWLWNFITWVSLFFTVLIMGLMFYFVIKYKRKHPDERPHGMHHNTALELGWSIPPLLIVLAIFVWGFRGFLDITTPPANSYEVLVTSYKWGWSFTHPNGGSSDELHIPADRPVKLVLESQDVIHSLFVPAFRAKKDCVPGRYNEMWFEAPWNPQLAEVNQERVNPEKAWTQAPTMAFDLYCAEYCGTSHSRMITMVYVHQQESFEAYLDDLANWMEGMPPADIGARLYQTKGCIQCHSLDGTSGNGPTFRNIYGTERVMTNGERVVADNNYLRQSILYPNQTIVAGYQPVMPRINLNDVEVAGLIAYIKTLSDDYTGDQVSVDVDGVEETEKTDPGVEATTGAIITAEQTGQEQDNIQQETPPDQE